MYNASMRFLLPLCLITACSTQTPEDTGSTFDPNPPEELGGDRPADVVLPDDYDITQRYPLVIMLHGYGANSVLQDAIFGLTVRAEAGSFILVKPNGTVDEDGQQFWNAATECCDFGQTGVDDVGYLAGLITQATSLYPTSHVALVGHSNGGYMSYRMACEHPENIDRIASLAGTMSSVPSECPGSEPVRVLHMHGTADETIAYESSGSHIGAEESLAHWTELASCTGPTDAGTRDYLNAVDGEEHQIQTWECPDGDMQLWTGVDGDHLYLSVNDAYKDALADWLTDP